MAENEDEDQEDKLSLGDLGIDDAEETDTSGDDGASDGAGEQDPAEILKAQLADAQRERDEARLSQQAAEAERRRLASEVQEHTKSKAESQKAILEHAMLAERSAADMAEAAYAAALEAGDFREASKQQRAMAAAEAKMVNMQLGIDSFEADDGAKDTPKQATQADPIEERISQFTPASQTWLRAHKADIFGNDARGQMAYAGHIMATNAGLALDSKEYFEFLDKHMGYVQDGKNGGAMPTPGAANYSAPPNKHAAPANPSTQIRLTAEERELAEAMGMTLKDYAASKKAIAEGKTHLQFSKDA